MSSENFSKSQFTFSKKEGQSELSILINNLGNHPRNIKLDIKDAETGNTLPATLDGVPYSHSLIIPEQAIRTLIVSVSEAKHTIAVEFLRESSEGGLSLRQKNSSSNGVITNIVELILK
ncbi:hypothetical protein A8709_14140 [Paenibacillus pectinilyticus]|uniref:Uncharacterized protein n=1 Tax=Paenibacillus pectinilyticus TaxID=512399 RepID=A0A1C1A3U9_9BACL|nr:hypothetical protein [Paenibacillus pectinilyticus]OCT15237.1 hypothetical protein A8709_14140 [Paenibacillus pectinilyticus]